METDLKKIWENTLNIIKGEMSEVSFNSLYQFHPIRLKSVFLMSSLKIY